MAQMRICYEQTRLVEPVLNAVVARPRPINIPAVGPNNNVLLAMFEDLDDNSDDDIAAAASAAVAIVNIREILESELEDFKIIKGLRMIDGPNGPTGDHAEYTDPLKWWKENESRFPHISGVARKFLSIPATSAPSERVFSAAGLTITKTRASLSPDHAAELIFLHDSWEYAEKYQKQHPHNKGCMVID